MFLLLEDKLAYVLKHIYKYFDIDFLKHDMFFHCLNNKLFLYLNDVVQIVLDIQRGLVVLKHEYLNL